MKGKRALFSAIFIIFLLVLAGGIYFYFNLNVKRQNEESVISVSPTPEITIDVTSLESWEDQSEFILQYPKGVLLDIHNEDEENYAHLEFRIKDFPVSVTVWCKDFTYKTIDEYLISQNAVNPIDSKLGGIEAKKYLIKGNPQLLKISAVRGDYLYEIESDFQQDTQTALLYKIIIDTFQFTKEDEKSTQKIQNNNPSEDVYSIFEEEEFIE